MSLKTDFKDEILQASEKYRKYNIIDENGNIIQKDIHLEKSYTPLQEGDIYGSKNVNEQNNHINQLSNPNLLINGDFQVWRRGSTFSNIANKYFADRWIAIGSKAINVTKVSTGARIQSVDSSYARFGQHIEGKLTQGKYTLSISINGKKDKITFDVVGDNSESFVNCDSCYASLSYTSNGNTLLLIGVSSSDFVVNWVKIDHGELATPNVPRPYGEELALCQRYYQSVSSRKSCTYQTIVYCETSIDLPVDMRGNPTFLFLGITVKRYDGTPVEKTGSIGFSKLNDSSYLISTYHVSDQVYQKYIIYDFNLDSEIY